MQIHNINVKITLLLQLLSPSASSCKRNVLHLLSTCFLGTWTAKKWIFLLCPKWQCPSQRGNHKAFSSALEICLPHRCIQQRCKRYYSLCNMTLAFHKLKHFSFLCSNRKHALLNISWYISSKHWSISGVLRKIHSQKLFVSEFVSC